MSTTHITPAGTDLDLTEFFTADTYTPYGVCTVVNRVLTALGVDQTLPPQMFYTYAKKGLLVKDANGVGVKDVKTVTKDQAMTWTTKYLVKKFS